MIFRPLPALMFCDSKTSSPPTPSPLGGLAGLGRPHLLTYGLRTVPKERPFGRLDPDHPEGGRERGYWLKSLDTVEPSTLPQPHHRR